MPGSKELSILKNLVCEKQYQSAIQFGYLVIGASDAQNTTLDNIEFTILVGDALFEQKQYQRSLALYRSVAEKFRMKPFETKPTNTAFDSIPKPVQIPPSLREKIATCCLEIKGELMEKEAIEQLSLIDTEHRSLKICMTLASLHRCRGSAKTAANYYLEAVRTNAYCLEAIIGYMETTRVAMSASASNSGKLWCQTMDTLRQTYDQDSCSSIAKLVRQWVDLQYYKICARPQQAITIARQMSSPGNLYIMNDVAECYYRMARSQEALVLFQKIRTADPYFINGMDLFSTLLRNIGNINELRKLADDTMGFAAQAPETWIIASVAKSAMTEASDYSSIDYAMRAVPLAPCFHRSYLLVASQLVAQGNTSEGIRYFLKALSINKDVPAYQGIVRAYVKDNNGRAALAAAKESMDLFPESPVAWAMAGQVYHGLLKNKLARNHYNEALRLDPQCADAHLPLSDLDCEEGKQQDAIRRLTSEIPSEQLLLKLASIHVALRDVESARAAYQQALHLNPSSLRAKELLAKLDEYGM
eukprot:TRINITY_DN37017_c0_g1_i1.p1 TRINITY_DN37017_c0_g1~~TRINITY_DN37017_c0_g1_i1.p1  ORF type:complete len:531 (+),score=56.96 TRINITY_DN37017_c0_g1_i1:101-1693(+)